MDGGCGAEDYLDPSIAPAQGPLAVAVQGPVRKKSFPTVQLAFIRNCVKKKRLCRAFDGPPLVPDPGGLIVQNSILAELFEPARSTLLLRGDSGMI